MKAEILRNGAVILSLESGHEIHIQEEIGVDKEPDCLRIFSQGSDFDALRQREGKRADNEVVIEIGYMNDLVDPPQWISGK